MDDCSSYLTGLWGFLLSNKESVLGFNQMQLTILIVDYSVLKSDTETCWGGYAHFNDDTNAYQDETFTESAVAEPKQQQQCC